jgi:hypothetical protein
LEAQQILMVMAMWMPLILRRFSANGALQVQQILMAMARSVQLTSRPYLERGPLDAGFNPYERSACWRDQRNDTRRPNHHLAFC